MNSECRTPSHIARKRSVLTLIRRRLSTIYNSSIDQAAAQPLAQRAHFDKETPCRKPSAKIRPDKPNSHNHRALPFTTQTTFDCASGFMQAILTTLPVRTQGRMAKDK